MSNKIQLQLISLHMMNEFALLKLQTINGEEHFIHSLPAIIASKRAKETTPPTDVSMQVLPITSIINSNPYHALIYYQEGNYKLIAITSLLVNSQPLTSNRQLIDRLKTGDKPVPWVFREFLAQLLQAKTEVNASQSVILGSISKLTIQSSHESEIYYICQPSANQQRILPTSQKQTNNISQTVVKPTTTATVNGSKWSTDDHQQLKKLLLQYGYGRWKQIQRSSLSIGGKLQNKPLAEIQAYANSFLRALGLSLPEDQTNLKIFLQKMIEQNQQEYQQYQPCLKEWDQHIMLPQRSVQYTKRLQLLFRVKNLIRKYRQDALKYMNPPDRRKISWDGLLNFIPLGLLFGQRPAVWWAKKNDIDLLLGVYKYGYANYVSIRNARQYCFAELQKAQTYQDFPVADNLTRRLKKLINTIVKIQQNQGEIDFEDEAESEEDEKSWTDNEKKVLFSIVSDYGVPIGTDNKSNWSELKDRVKTQIKQFGKTPSQVEKMVSRMRWNCQQIISDEKMREQVQGTGSFKITYDMAAKFSKNINLLQFVRRSIMLMEPDNLKIFLKEVEEKSETLGKEHPAHLQAKLNDQTLLNHVNKSGIIAISSMKLGDSKVLARLQWLCEVYKVIKQKVQDKKKKYKTFDESTKKKAKFELNRDKEGNIKFPININPSLILVATGQINVNPNYHSEHNLFPVGYISIRTHASMFSRGVRARYTCQIIQGDGKPIYKVTPEEDPTNSIIKDSSTGCWVYICNKVNQLQEVKKEKVTISGTQRFGLLQHNVVRLLQDLPNAQKCTKYKFKKNLPKQPE